MGFLMTILMGIAGSFLAGVIAQSLGLYQAGERAGIIASVIVAIILLVIFGRSPGEGWEWGFLRRCARLHAWASTEPQTR